MRMRTYIAVAALSLVALRAEAKDDNARDMACDGQEGAAAICEEVCGVSDMHFPGIRTDVLSCSPITVVQLGELLLVDVVVEGVEVVITTYDDCGDVVNEERIPSGVLTPVDVSGQDFKNVDIVIISDDFPMR